MAGDSITDKIVRIIEALKGPASSAPASSATTANKSRKGKTVTIIEALTKLVREIGALFHLADPHQRAIVILASLPFAIAGATIYLRAKAKVSEFSFLAVVIAALLLVGWCIYMCWKIESRNIDQQLEAAERQVEAAERQVEAANGIKRCVGSLRKLCVETRMAKYISALDEVVELKNFLTKVSDKAWWLAGKLQLPDDD